LAFRVEPVKLILGPAGAGLRGRTIAQLSDIHLSPYLTARDLRRAVDMTNELAPDFIFLTGDFVTFSGQSQYDCVRELMRLRARTAILGCLGNHEIYTDTEASITRLFARQGVDILRFQGRSFDLGSSRLNIAGVDFIRRHEEGVLQGVAPFLKHGEVNVLLTHNPNAFDFLGNLPVDVCISGHTHGGQLRLEFVDADVSPARLMTSYVGGLYRRGNQQLYVNRGLGTIGIPIRLGAPPEITLYELA
jgi:predicted MPP superfamily phosphohydrolase